MVAVFAVFSVLEVEPGFPILKFAFLTIRSTIAYPRITLPSAFDDTLLRPSVQYVDTSFFLNQYSFGHENQGDRRKATYMAQT